MTAINLFIMVHLAYFSRHFYAIPLSALDFGLWTRYTTHSFLSSRHSLNGAFFYLLFGVKPFSNTH